MAQAAAVTSHLSEMALRALATRAGHSPARWSAKFSSVMRLTLWPACAQPGIRLTACGTQ